MYNSPYRLSDQTQSAVFFHHANDYRPLAYRLTGDAITVSEPSLTLGSPQHWIQGEAFSLANGGLDRLPPNITSLTLGGVELLDRSSPLEFGTDTNRCELTLKSAVSLEQRAERVTLQFEGKPTIEMTLDAIQGGGTYLAYLPDEQHMLALDLSERGELTGGALYQLTTQKRTGIGYQVFLLVGMTVDEWQDKLREDEAQIKLVLREFDAAHDYRQGSITKYGAEPTPANLEKIKNDLKRISRALDVWKRDAKGLEAADKASKRAEKTASGKITKKKSLLKRAKGLLTRKKASAALDKTQFNLLQQEYNDRSRALSNLQAVLKRNKEGLRKEERGRKAEGRRLKRGEKATDRLTKRQRALEQASLAVSLTDGVESYSLMQYRSQYYPTLIYQPL